MKTRVVILSAAVLVAVSASAAAGTAETLAFAIGQCSSQPDGAARLACYDRIAAQLRDGSFLSSAPQASQTSPPFVSVPTPGATAQAYTPPPPRAQTYVPPPAPVAQGPAPIVQPPVSQPQVAQAPAPRREKSSWYDPTSWFGNDSAPTESSNPADFGGESVQRPAAAVGQPDRPAPLDHITANVSTVAYNPNGRFTVTLENGQVWKQIDADTGTARFKNKGRDVVTISRGLLGSYNLVLEGQTALFKVKRIR